MKISGYEDEGKTYRNESQNLVGVTSPFTTSFPPASFFFFIRPPIACPRHRSTKALCISDTGSMSATKSRHSALEVMTASGGLRKASIARTLPFCSCQQKCLISAANRNSCSARDREKIYTLFEFATRARREAYVPRLRSRIVRVRAELREKRIARFSTRKRCKGCCFSTAKMLRLARAQTKDK